MLLALPFPSLILAFTFGAKKVPVGSSKGFSLAVPTSFLRSSFPEQDDSWLLSWHPPLTGPLARAGVSVRSVLSHRIFLGLSPCLHENPGFPSGPRIKLDAGFCRPCAKKPPQSVSLSVCVPPTFNTFRSPSFAFGSSCWKAPSLNLPLNLFEVPPTTQKHYSYPLQSTPRSPVFITLQFRIFAYLSLDALACLELFLFPLPPERFS